MAEKVSKADKNENSVNENKTFQLEEYKEVGNNMRHFSNMRFAVMTISLAINGVILDKLTDIREGFIKISLILLGIILTPVFLVIENRVTAYYLYYQKRAKQLDELLLFTQYSRQMEKPKINATFVTKFLYLSFIIIWIVLLYKEICYKFL